MSLAFDVANLVLGIIGLAGFFDLVFLYVKSRLPTSRLALLDDHLAYTGHMFRSAAESHLITEETALGVDRRLLKYVAHSMSIISRAKNRALKGSSQSRDLEGPYPSRQIFEASALWLVWRTFQGD